MIRKCFFNTVNKSQQDLPIEMEYNNEKADNESDIANLFADFFTTAYTQHNSGAIAQYDENNEYIGKIRDICSNIPQIDITEEVIAKQIDELPNNMVSGPDGLPNLFIKKCMKTLLKPITMLLKESIENAEVPDIWKQSFLRPIFKSGSKNKINNYRGVAIQNIIVKLLDSIIARHLNFHARSIIDETQHGFVRGKSTVTNLIEFTSSTITNMKPNTQTDAIYLDIAKAFDSVNIELLLYKLRIMGLNNQILNWIKTYLNGRKQIVKINDTTSNPIDVTSGTGQGYPIGATLFIFLIVELPYYITKSKISSFADDTRLWIHVESTVDCLNLQEDLNRLVEFFKRNQLKLNVSKTKMMRFHRSGILTNFIYKIDDENIARVDEIKDLGIILDVKLQFKSHIEFIIARAKSILAWIKRFAYEFEDPWTIKRLFYAFVLPIIEYGSQIWNPFCKNQVIRLESIQKQFLLYALRRMNWADRFQLPAYKQRLNLLQMLTLEERRSLAQAIFITKIINGGLISNFILSKINFRVPSHSTRDHRLLEIPNELQNYRKYEPSNYMLETYNKFCNMKMPNTNEYVIDFNISIEVVKNRIIEILKRNHI